MTKLVKREYWLPFILVTSLFFIWGFARSIMDVLNKHYQTELDITISQSTAIQGVFFLGYFLLAIPAGFFITKYGYRKGVVFGLLLFGLGAICFGLGSSWFDMSGMNVFYLFLASLFVVACGLVFLETAANPYMTELGSAETAASRLNLAQSFNGLGNICGPWLGGIILFSGSGSSLATPYIIIGGMVLVLALLFSRVNLPEIQEDSEKAEDLASAKPLLANRLFVFGFIALLAYEIAEISINSLFVNYAETERGINKLTASEWLSFGFVLFMCARFAGSWLMSKVPAEKVLLCCSIGSAFSCLIVFLNIGKLSMLGLMLNYLFEAIMFPTIFSLALRNLGSQTKRASSYLMLSTIGGAIGTVLMGVLADKINLSFSFIVPLASFLVVLAYSWRVNTVTSGQAPKRKGNPT
ncbi:MAG: sugar MFS transporter [Bacteroidaceae bacterium]|nr:sugar MFS transporter [Bacteroidaceae bacterium]MBR1542077.1 sugar MFS transporter [Bacteroidaceae bacterium]